MTDTERERIKAICEIAGVSEIDDLSDGFHTFAQLYYQRMILFAVIVKQNKDKSWKSLRHEDGELCFGGGWFIVGIDTPEGSYTYHYEDNYYSLFDCEELERGKHWDGHTEKDVTRLLALPSAQPEQPTGVQDILQYLDEYLHPIVSPEHWSVYSELYDMVSMLQSAQPRKTGNWNFLGEQTYECTECGRVYTQNQFRALRVFEKDTHFPKFCPNCGADNGGKKMMTLDEAIRHCEEVADRCAVTECEMEHRQLAEWLKELKQRRTEQYWIPCSDRLPEEDDTDKEE